MMPVKTVEDFKCKKCKQETSARVDSERYSIKLCNDCDDKSKGIYTKDKIRE